MTVRFDPISVDDKYFYAFKQIELSAFGMMIRELMKNAMDAAISAPIGNREIVIDHEIHYGTPKLRMWNTGTGMDADSLYRMGDLGCVSEKVHGLDRNFGEGAKVAALRDNSLGMIYTSCRDGIVSRVWLAKFGEQYGRHVFDDPRVTSVANSVLDVTDEYTDVQRSKDWTQVVLLGKSEDQNTVTDPYGNGDAPKTWLAGELYQRFFRVDPTFDIILKVAHNHINSKNPVRHFRTVEERRDLNHFTRCETVNVDGLKIHFIHDAPYNSNRESDKHQPLQSSIPFGGIIYKDELYSVINVVKGHNHWTDKAPILGITFGAKNISVFVEIPDDYPVVPETHRRNLLHRDRTQLVLEEQFAGLVYASRPQWIKDLVTGYGPNHETSIDDLQKRLRELMSKLHLREDAKVVTTEDSDTQVDDGQEAEVIVLDREPVEVVSEHHGGGGHREPEKKSGLNKPARNAMIDFPIFDIRLLRDEEEIAEKLIVGKAAKFVRTGRGTVFINMRYPAIDKLATELAPIFINSDQDLFRPQMMKLIEDEMMYRVCATVVRALSKQRDVWPRDSVDKALEPECFSMAADCVEEDAGKIKQRLVMLFGNNLRREDAM